MPLEREVLPDRTEAREELLGTFGQAEPFQASLALPRRLMTVLCPVVDAGRRLDEDVLHVRQFRNVGLCRGRPTK